VITATPLHRPGLADGKLLVRLSEPISYTTFVAQPGNEGGELPYLEERQSTEYALVSAVDRTFEHLPSPAGDGPAKIVETMIFPADHTGAVLDWAELHRLNGVADTGVAVRAAGWKLVF
jgi:hypothetical protein